MRPWDTLPGEPPDAYAAFSRWLTTGRGRTFDHVDAWRHRWGWDARGDAYEAHLDSARLAAEITERAGVFGLRARAIDVANSALEAVRMRTENELAAAKAAPGAMSADTYRDLLRAAQVSARIGQAFPAPPPREERGRGIRADRLTASERLLLAELLARANVGAES